MQTRKPIPERRTTAARLGWTRRRESLVGPLSALWLLACSGTLEPSPAQEVPSGSSTLPGGALPPGTDTSTSSGNPLPGGTAPIGSAAPGAPMAGATASAGLPGAPAAGDPAATAGVGSEQPPPGQEAVPYEPPPAPLRRLTRTQFQNAVRDIFGVEVAVSDLDADSWEGHFATIGASTIVTSERGVEQYQAAIEAAVDAVFRDPAQGATFVGCEPSGQPGDACLRGYVESLGRRAWRRPLQSTETDLIERVALDTGAELESPMEGARWATVVLFTSPNFLYRPELGVVGPDGVHRISGFEMAGRLAFLIWNSLPDDQLLDDAAAGLLDTPLGARTAAERMLDAPLGREAAGAFAQELMRLDRIATQAKDATLFPEYTPSLQSAMERDMREAWKIVAFDEEGSVLDLFSTSTVVVNRDLAELYGLDSAGLDASTFEVRSLPQGDPRVGILGKAAFLSQFANQKEGSPTLRGKFIREALMCMSVPPPPPDVSTVLEESTSDQPMTKRDRLAAHSEDPSCALCHSLMDPLGLPFETFDAVGRLRTTDNGLPIDPSSEFDGQAVLDASGMAMAIGGSDSVIQCLTRRFYTYAIGHEERDADGSVIAELQTEFAAAEYRFRDLVLAVVSHEAFSSVVPQP